MTPIPSPSAPTILGVPWSDALIAVGTVGGLAVALALGLSITGWLFRPRLTVNIVPGFPDFCSVDATVPINSFTQAKVSDQYWCRFRVRNGRRFSVSANDVEVLLSQLGTLVDNQRSRCSHSCRCD